MFRIYVVQLEEPVCIVIIMRLFWCDYPEFCLHFATNSVLDGIFYFVCLFPGASFSDSVNYKTFVIDEWI